MPRAAARTRRPTEADLSRDQREIYDVLRDDLKEKYLKQLPPVPVSGILGRKKAHQLRERIALLDRTQEGIQTQKEHLAQVARDLEQGAVGPDTVDLRLELRPPSIAGVSLRFVRAGKGE